MCGFNWSLQSDTLKVGVGTMVGRLVGTGVAVGCGVAVGMAVGIGWGVAVGCGVAVGNGVGTACGVGVGKGVGSGIRVTVGWGVAVGKCVGIIWGVTVGIESTMARARWSISRSSSSSEGPQADANRAGLTRASPTATVRKICRTPLPT